MIPGRRSGNNFTRIGIRPDQEATPDRAAPEAGSSVAKPVNHQPPGGQTRGDREYGWEAKGLTMKVTAKEIDEAPATMESGDSRDSINISLIRVQASLEQHQEAQMLRERSRSVFAQSESISEEAIRSAEAAGKAYGEGFAADSTANMDALAKVRDMAKTLESRLESNRSAYRDALGNAFGMKEIAAQDLNTALDSLNSAVANVAGELEESTRAAALADASTESATQGLKAVQTLWNELAALRSELLAQPTPESNRHVPPETTERVSQARPATELEEPYVVRQELTAEDAGSLAVGMSAGQATEDQVLNAAAGDAGAEDNEQSEVHPAVPPAVTKAESLTGDPVLDLEIANAQPATDFPGSVGASPAEALRQELAGLTATRGDGQADSQNMNLEGAEKRDPAVPDPDPANDILALPVTSGNGLARSYTGRVYLMFDASLTQQGLESVWEAIEEAAKTGVIVDTRMLSRDDGVQLTLDLDETRLDVTALLQRLPGAKLMPLADDRLKVARPAA